jgi:hypothetical protein
MLELNRILLRNFGPSEARYENVDLDLSGAGEPVAQPGLLGGNEEGRVETRPAAASLLLLPNGGGKGILFHALQTTITPFRHRDNESLRKFAVSMRQPSHVVLEWANRANGQLLVTAQILALTGSGEIARRFYTFRPGPVLDADRLPFTHDGKWTDYDAYLSQLDDLKTNSALEFQTKRTLEAWEQLEATLGIDPDLFGVQWRMNAEEGAASSAIARTSGSKFVEWLLRQVTPAEKYQAIEDRFRDYRGEVGRHDSLRGQHTYTTVMERECEAVDRAGNTRREKDRDHQAAADRLAGLNQAIGRRVSAVVVETATLASQLETVKASKEVCDAQLDLARRRRGHVQMAELQLQRREKQQQVETITEQIDPARIEADAWPAVDILIDQRATVKQHGSVQQDLTRAEGAVKAATSRLDQAGAKARAGYAIVIDQDQETLKRLDVEGQHETGRIRTMRDEANQLRTTIARTETEAQQHQRQIENADGALRRARETGLVDAEESAADAAGRLTKTVASYETRLQSAETDLEEAETEADHASTAAAERRTEAAEAGAEANARERDLAHIRAEAASIVAGALVSEISETDRAELDAADPLTWLDDHSQHLERQCQTTATLIETQQRAPRRDIEAAERLLSALDTSAGLLPPRDAVESILRLLNDHKMAAVSGWQWLSDNCASGDHPRTIAAHPDLVEGVVVNDDDAVAQARQLVDEAKMLPQAAVVIAASACFEPDPSALDSARFVPRPTPALHDTDEAERERLTIEARLTEARDRLTGLQERLSAVQSLQRDLGAWRGRLQGHSATTWIEQTTAALSRARELKDAAETAANRAAASAEAVKTARAAREALAAELPALRGRCERAAALADQLVEVEPLGPEIYRINTDNTRRRAQIVALGEQVDDAERANGERMRHTSEVRHRLAVNRTAREAIVCTPDAERHQAAGTETLAPLADLVADLERAQTAFKEAEIGIDLRDQAIRVERRLTELQTKWGKLDQKVRTRAEDLIADPRATSAAERRIATEDAHRRFEDLKSTKHLYVEQLGRIDERLKAAGPTQGRARWLSDDEQRDEWTPATANEVAELLATADRMISEHTAACRKAAAELQSLSQQLSRRNEYLQQLKVIHSRTTEAASDIDRPAPPGPTQVPEAIPELEAAAGETIASYRTSGKETRKALATLREAVSRMERANERQEFSALGLSIQKQIKEFPPEQYVVKAAAWVEALRTYRGAIDLELDQADERRHHVVRYLKEHAIGALRLLRRTSGTARVPDGDSPWAGTSFLEIRFTNPSEETIAGCARSTVDRLAHQTSASGGIDLILSCMREAVPTGFAVKILKPTPTGSTTTMVSIERMKTEFSGGQELTGSILVYCVLALLKNADGVKRRDAHGGTLFLDNPLGRANADYLMHLQFAIARAMNVQLICTTPLSEDRAIGHFPLQIHMINDATVRQGTSLIRIAERARSAIAPPPFDPDPNAPAPTGIIGAARLHNKDSAP